MRNIINPVTSLLKYLCFTLIFTLIGLAIGSQLPPSFIYMMNKLFFVFIIVTFICALLFKRSIGGRRRGMSMIGVYLYSIFLGVTIYPSINYYLYDLGGEMVFFVFLGTLIMVGILSIFSFNKGTDKILKLGPILFAITMAMLLISLLSMFIGNISGIDLIYTIASLIIFSLWIVYDVYRFKKDSIYITTTRDLAPYVLDIYIDIINIFLDLLRIFSRLKDD